MRVSATFESCLILLWVTVVDPLDTTTKGRPMRCHDGKCADDVSKCGVCEGAGCLRVTRYENRRGATVALTCLPYAQPGLKSNDDAMELVRSEGAAVVSSADHLEPPGCRQLRMTGGRMCICYETDFCNSAAPSAVRRSGGGAVRDLSSIIGGVCRPSLLPPPVVMAATLVWLVLGRAVGG